MNFYDLRGREVSRKKKSENPHSKREEKDREEQFRFFRTVAQNCNLPEFQPLDRANFVSLLGHIEPHFGRLDHRFEL